jgi:hypothetical protein
MVQRQWANVQARKLQLRLPVRLVTRRPHDCAINAKTSLDNTCHVIRNNRGSIRRISEVENELPAPPNHSPKRLSPRGARCSPNVLAFRYRYRELSFRLSLPMPSVSVFAAQITEIPRPLLLCTNVRAKRCDG